MRERKLAVSLSTLRLLSVMSSTDPRTVRKVLEGKPVRGLSAIRVREALERLGIRTGHEVDDAHIRDAIRDIERRTRPVSCVLDSEFDD